MTIKLCLTIIASLVSLAQTPKPIAWSADRPLSWADFGGRPDMGADAAALTIYMIGFEEECDGDNYIWSVTSEFQPASSWVRPSVLLKASESQRILRHEQTHFNLSEVHVRMLRKALRDMDQPCRKTAAARKALVTEFVKSDSLDQRKYDRDTNYGLDDRQQAKWESDVAKQLAALAKYVHGLAGQ